MPEILTVEQAAEFLHVAPNTVYEAIRRGDLPHLRVGRTIRIRLDQLLDSFTTGRVTDAAS